MRQKLRDLPIARKLGLLLAFNTTIAVVAIALVFGFVAVAFVYPPRNGFIQRKRGVFLLGLYVAYLVTILQQ